MSQHANIEEAKQLSSQLDQLIETVRDYYPRVDEAFIRKAYTFSANAHADQTRHSGELYISHPLAVAQILANLHMDVPSICTALLHDTVEDTSATYEDVQNEFGEEIAKLVNGVTKLGQFELSSEAVSKERKQAENFQKFVLHMSRDVRVLIVKLCDRLHNMRTLEFHPKPESQRRISLETMEIYAPLARRIGVDRICSELEDLAFRYIDPTGYETICNRLETWRNEQATQISQMSTALRDVMDQAQIPTRIYGREKRPFAIWRKLERQGISFDHVADLYAFRIIVPRRSLCYRVLGVLHMNYSCVPARFRDFISVPKPNGYQSLHTTIMGPGNTRVEIQIRTERMEDVAERGVAAHWLYKDESYNYDPKRAEKAHGMDPMSRLRPFVELIEQSGDADEFLEHAKLEMYTDQIFAFTPKGRLISLPRGAMPLDFAYALHTDIGDSCVGVRINDRAQPLGTLLKNGDVVKIIRGGMKEPLPDWQSLVTTGRARSGQRRLTRENESHEFKRIGAQMVEHAFLRENVSQTTNAIEGALKRLKYETIEDVHEALGAGHISLSDFMGAVFPGRDATKAMQEDSGRDLIEDESAKLYVRGDGLTPGVSLHFANCCSPIPGDRIVGVQDVGKGIMIHTIDCETLESDTIDAAKWFNMAWRRNADNADSHGRITATVEHVPGALADVTRIIGAQKGNLTSIKTIKRTNSFFDMIFEIEVRDNRHLSRIIAALRTSAFVVNVQRTRGAEKDSQ